jgi:hypothetical protein
MDTLKDLDHLIGKKCIICSNFNNKTFFCFHLKRVHEMELNHLLRLLKNV